MFKEFIGEARKEIARSSRVEFFDIARKNKYYRRVVMTGKKIQLVVMSLKPGEDIGKERHRHVEQTLFCVSGKGFATLNGKKTRFNAGDTVVVKPMTYHNFTNSGDESMKIATIYSPPNHIDGRIHKTKADAKADKADEDFGHHV